LKAVSAEKAELIAEAARHGFTVSAKQIDRWRLDHVLPTPGKVGAGRGRGVQRPTPEGSAVQLLRLCRLLSQDRSLHRAAFRLWIEDYSVPLDRLRTALASLVRDPRVVFGPSGEHLQEKLESYAEGMSRNQSAKPHVKKMADDGRLAVMLEGLIGLGLGRSIPLNEQQQLGATFEEFSGLNRGRTDHWKGKSPWLTSDSTPEIAMAASMFERVGPALAHSAADEDFIKAKEAFQSQLKLRNCAEMLQQLHGSNVFGFAALTDLPIGVPMSYADPSAFLAMLALVKAQPEVLDNVIQIGKSLDAHIDTLRQQVANLNRK
jgi:hypothetical protein